MKKNLLILSTLLAIVFTTIFSSCKKGVNEAVTLDRAAGKWSINSIRYQIYNGSATPQDSTVPWRPNPENFIIFDGVSAFQYAFNTTVSTNGIYSFAGQDSININMDSEATRWKVLLLTSTNFNITRTSTHLHDFPGATVVIYQSFVR